MSPEPLPSADASTPPVLVTGAAGHVGANLVRRLLEDGVRVRVLLRHEDNNAALEGLDVERTFGDIRDLNATRRAIEGCQGVYHVAARISTIEGNRAHRREVFDCNVVGTRNVLRAARETEAGRVVMTGSFSAVGYDLDNPSAPSNEAMQYRRDLRLPLIRADERVRILGALFVAGVACNPVVASLPAR